MDTATLMKPQPEGLVGKVVNLLCHCSPESLCRECCECCLEKREPETREITHIKISPHGTRRITKEDIQPVIISQQPQSQNSISQMRTRLNSTNSETESETEKSEHSGAGVSRGGSFYSAQNSPVNRERLDSTDKWSTPSRNSSRTGSRHGSTSSRKGSTSSGDYPLSKRGGGCANNPTPVIDMKPIEFWAATNKETVQPRTPKKRLLSESEISVDDFKPHLYEAVDGESNQCLTDEQKLARFRLGELHISLHYDMGAKCLLVRVIEAKDLPKPYCHDSSRQDMAHSNPYCKVCLLPDRKTLQQTTVQRKTQSPQWDETFTFEVPFKEVQTRKIELVVKDFDKFSRHCVVGEVTLRLDDDNLNLVKGCHMWKPIMPCEKLSPDLGEVLVSLNYLPCAGRLNVDVIKARQLLQTDLLTSDPYVKLVLWHGDRIIKCKKTSVKKSTIDPVFNESLSFNITSEQLEQISLLITVWNHSAGTVKDDIVGRVVLGRQATGHFEVSHWNRMLQCQRSPVAQWHTLLSKEECDAKSAISAAVF